MVTVARPTIPSLQRADIAKTDALNTLVQPDWPNPHNLSMLNSESRHECEAQQQMDLKASVGWFGVLLASACVMVSAIAGFAALSGPDPTEAGPSDLMVPIAMLFLKPIAFATMAAGAVGLFWQSEADAGGHNLRCWGSLVTGAAAAALSLMFGPSY